MIVHIFSYGTSFCLFLTTAWASLAESQPGMLIINAEGLRAQVFAETTSLYVYSLYTDRITFI